MSESIELSIGGNNEKLLAVLKDSEKAARDSAKKIKAELDKAMEEAAVSNAQAAAKLDADVKKSRLKVTQESKEGIKSILSDLAQVRTAGGAVETVLSKLGGALKASGLVAGAVGFGTAFAKAAYSANNDANQLYQRMEAIRRAQNNGVANVSSGNLADTLGSIRAERRGLFDVSKYDSDIGVVRDFKMFKDSASRGIKDLLTTGGSGWSGKQDEKLFEEEQIALERIGEKQAEVLKIERERIKGSKAQADIMQLEAEYAERLNEARAGGKGSIGQVQALTDERELRIAEVQRQAELADISRRGSANRLYIQGRDLGAGNPVDLARGDLQNAKSAAGLASTEEDKKDAELRVKAAEVALKTAEKEESVRVAILETSQRVASFRGSDAERQLNSLQQEIQLSEKLLTLATSKIEKENAALRIAESRRALEEFQTTQRITMIGNDADIAGARISNLSARRGLGSSYEQEQRLSLEANIQKAGSDRDAAAEQLALRPGDIGLQKNAALAEEKLTAATIEKAKWERDIARTKADAVKLMDAEQRALDLTVQGREKEAQLVKEKADAEVRAAQAARAGNTELANQITNLANARVKAEGYAAAIDQSTGYLKPTGQVSGEAAAARRVRRNIKRSTQKLDENSGLVNVERDSDGNVISGIDPNTLERKRKNPKTGEMETVEDTTNPFATIGRWPRSRTGKGAPFSGSYKSRGETDWQSQLRPRAENARKEAEAAHAAAVAKSEQQQKEREEKTANDPQTNITKIRTILEDWSKVR